MTVGRIPSLANKTQVLVLTSDASFGKLAEETFGANGQIILKLVPGPLDNRHERLPLSCSLAAATT